MSDFGPYGEEPRDEPERPLEKRHHPECISVHFEPDQGQCNCRTLYDLDYEA